MYTVIKMSSFEELISVCVAHLRENTISKALKLSKLYAWRIVWTNIVNFYNFCFFNPFPSWVKSSSIRQSKITKGVVWASLEGKGLGHNFMDFTYKSTMLMHIMHMQHDTPIVHSIHKVSKVCNTLHTLFCWSALVPNFSNSLYYFYSLLHFLCVLLEILKLILFLYNFGEFSWWRLRVNWL